MAKNVAEWLLKITQVGASKAANDMKKLTSATLAATSAQRGLEKAMSSPLSSRKSPVPEAGTVAKFASSRKTLAGVGQRVAPSVVGRPTSAQTMVSAGGGPAKTILQKPVARAFKAQKGVGSRGTIAQAPVKDAFKPARSGTILQRPVAAAFKTPKAAAPKAASGGSVSASSAAGGSSFGVIGGKAALMGGPLGFAAAAASKGAELAKGAGMFAAQSGAWVVKTAEARQNMFTSFEVMLKSTDKASELMGGIEKFARDTPFTTGQVGDVMKSLVGAGYDAKTAFDIFKRIGDVSAFAGFDERALSGVTRAITQIKSKGVLQAEELNQIFEAAPGAVSRDTLVDKLAQNLGKSRGTITNELENGKIKAGDGIKALLDTVDSTVSGGKAGGLMAKLGSSITARLSSIMDMPSMLIGKTQDMPGLEAFRNTLGNMIEGFDAASGPLKSAVSGLINDVFGTLFGKLGSAGSKDTFKNMFEGIAKSIEWVRDTARGLAPYVLMVNDVFSELWSGFRQAWVAVSPALTAIGDGLKRAFGGDNASTMETISFLARKIGVAIGWASVAVVTLGSIFVGVGATLASIIPAAVSTVTYGVLTIAGTVIDTLGSLPARAIEIGTGIVEGLVGGVTSRLGSVGAVMSSLVNAVVGGAETPLEINSPSKVFERIGGYVAAGMAGGIQGGAGDVAGAASGLAGAATGGARVGLLPAAGGGGGGPGGGGAPIQIIYNIDATGLGDREAGEAIAEKLSDTFDAKMRSWCENALAQLGGPGFGPAT